MNAHTIVKSMHGMWVGSYGLVRCPCHDDRKPSLKIKDDARKSDGIDLICFAGCDWKDVKAELQRQGLIDAGMSQRQIAKAVGVSAQQVNRDLSPKVTKRVTKSDTSPTVEWIENEDDDDHVNRAIKLWQQSIPLPDTLGWKYFTERRGLHIGVLGPLDHALRFHPGKRAVIGLMTDPVTNKPTGVHRTYLRPDATNVVADGRNLKLMLGPQGVIRLSRNEDVTTGLGITEGIEDGLAVLLSGWSPVWAASCAGAITRFSLESRA
jgi:hypothetical protein